MDIKQIKNKVKKYSKKQDKVLKTYKTSVERIAFIDGCIFANENR